MVERFVGSGRAAELLGYDDRSVRRLRTEGRFPAHEVEIEEANRVVVGWRLATIEALSRHLAAPEEHPVPTPAEQPNRFLGMTIVAKRYGFSKTRGYQRLATGDFPPVAVELEQPRRPVLGWDAQVVEDYEPRMNRLPGRPQGTTKRGGSRPRPAGESRTLPGMPADPATGQPEQP